jgi:hypothetical protein
MTVPSWVVIWHGNPNQTNIMIDIIGWIGACLVIFAYYQAARNFWPSNSKSASVVNFFGGLLLGVSAFFHGAWPNFGLEIIFVLIALTTFKKSR